MCDVFIESDFKDSHLVFRVEDIELNSDCMNRIQFHAEWVFAGIQIKQLCRSVKDCWVLGSTLYLQSKLTG